LAVLNATMPTRTEVDTSFDFDGDGTPEDAEFGMTLERD